MLADTPQIITPDGWERVCGPMTSVATLTLVGGQRRRLRGCVTVGNRVIASWQRFGYLIGTGTVVGFERHREAGWIKVVIDYDYPEHARVDEDGFVRWDYDRTILCDGHWPGETQQESVTRHREFIRSQREAAAA